MVTLQHVRLLPDVPIEYYRTSHLLSVDEPGDIWRWSASLRGAFEVQSVALSVPLLPLGLTPHDLGEPGGKADDLDQGGLGCQGHEVRKGDDLA